MDKADDCKDDWEKDETFAEAGLSAALVTQYNSDYSGCDAVDP